MKFILDAPIHQFVGLRYSRMLYQYLSKKYTIYEALILLQSQ